MDVIFFKEDFRLVAIAASVLAQFAVLACSYVTPLCSTPFFCLLICLTPTPAETLQQVFTGEDGGEGGVMSLSRTLVLTDLFPHRLETSTSTSLWGSQVNEDRIVCQEVCVRRSGGL